MIPFQKLTLTDCARIRPFFENYTGRLCDFSVAGMIMWRDLFDIGYFCDGRTLIFDIRLLDGRRALTLPLGDCDYGLSLLSPASGTLFCALAEDDLSVLSERIPLTDASFDRRFSDYLYASDELISLRGKQFHGQKNNVNKFARLYPEADLRPLDRQTAADALALLDALPKKAETTPTVREERAKTYEVLRNLDLYRLHGAVLYVGDRAVGFTLGEVIGDTLFVHIEKADTTFHGAHQFLQQKFAETTAAQKPIRFINREEDDGDEGLRKAKLSLHPIALLNKYTAVVR